MSLKFDFWKYITKFAFSGATIALYDIFMDGISYKNWYVLKDAMTFGLSNVVSSAGSDLVLDLIGYNSENILSMLTEPVLNAFLYDYLYNTMIRYNNDYGRTPKRSST